MTFARFKALCKTICAKAGHGLVLQFSEEDGVFSATYGDIKITGRPGSDVSTVNWGSGHVAQFNLGEVQHG